jgi:branched-chain amino acid transport system permease protein
MDEILSLFVIGLSFGLVLFLLATGLSLTMGLMRIVNMAHGALYMMGAFVGLSVFNHTHSYVLAALAGAACAAAIGLLLEVGFLRRLYKQEASQVLLTIGFIYILMNIAQWIWTSFPASGIVPSVFSGSVRVGSVDIPTYRLFTIGLGLVMAVLLWLFQDKTKIGAKVRAGMDNREIAGALGINLKLVFTGIFALGSLVAGLSGVVGSKMTQVSLGLSWQTLLLSLIVVVIGGAGSVQGALLGGILLGLLNSFGAAYFPAISSYIVYIALILILLLRPSGLLGRKMAVHQATENLESASAYKHKPSKKNAAAGSTVVAETVRRSRLKEYLPYALAVALLVVLPPLVGTFTQGMFTKVLIFAIFAMSLDLIMGYTGLLSFGHAAYLGIAGYAVGILTINYHITSFWLVLPMALIIAAVLAAAIGFLALRVSGVYFLLVTMAFGQLLSVAATKWYSMTGGKDGKPGIQRPDLWFGSHSWTSLKLYFFVLVIFVVCFLILHRIVHSAFGKVLVGIRENEPRMKSLGFNTWALKYAAVVLAGVFAGVAGVLYAQSYGTMVPANFGLEMSALPMLMVIMGGGATLWGPCLGAAVIVLADHYSSEYAKDRWQLILGCIFVLCVMVVRGGFASYLSRLWARARLPGARKTVAEQTVGSEGQS